MAGPRLRGIIPPVTGLGQGIGNSSASFHVVCLSASEAEFHGVEEISCSESSSVSRVASPERPRSPGVLLTSPWALARPLSTSEKRRGKIKCHTLQNTRARDALPHQSSRLPYRLAACGRGEVRSPAVFAFHGGAGQWRGRGPAGFPSPSPGTRCSLPLLAPTKPRPARHLRWPELSLDFIRCFISPPGNRVNDNPSLTYLQW